MAEKNKTTKKLGAKSHSETTPRTGIDQCSVQKEEEQIKELKHARKVMKKAEKAMAEVDLAWDKFVEANSEWSIVDRKITFFHDMVVDRYFHGKNGNPTFIMERDPNQIKSIQNALQFVGHEIALDAINAAEKVEKALKKYVKVSTNQFVKEISAKDNGFKKRLEKRKLNDLVLPDFHAIHDFTFGLHRRSLRQYAFADIDLEQFRHWVMFGYSKDSLNPPCRAKQHDVVDIVTEYMNRFDGQTFLKAVSELSSPSKKSAAAFILATSTDAELIRIFESIQITPETIQRILVAIMNSPHSNIINGYIDGKARIAARADKMSSCDWTKYKNLPYINNPTDSQYRNEIGALFLENDFLDTLFTKSVTLILETLGELHGLDSYLVADKALGYASEKLHALFGTITVDICGSKHDLQIYLISGKETLMLVPEFSLHAVPVASGLKTVIAHMIMDYLIDSMEDDYPEGLKCTDLETYVGMALDDLGITEETLLEQLQLVNRPEWNF